MFTILIILITSLFISTTLILFGNKKCINFGILLFILMIVLFVSITWNKFNIALKDSRVITNIDVDDYIYYDCQLDKYFRLITNNWDIKELYSIEYIEDETALKIIDVAKIVNEWE